MAIDIKDALEVASFRLIDKEKAENIKIEDILGDETVLKNPIYDEGFKRVLELHKPRNKVAFLSLCTKSRPYSESPKWKKYLNTYENVDFVVTSNGGLFPEMFWNDFLALTYDAPARGSKDEEMALEFLKNLSLYEDKLEGQESSLSTEEVNELYKKKLYQRLLDFFTTFNYSYVFGDFTPNMRNYSAFIEAMEYLKANKHIKDYRMPDPDILQELDLEEEMYPGIDERYIKRVKRKLLDFVEKKSAEDMIAEFLQKNEVKACKDFIPSGKRNPKGAKNKNFVTDASYASGNRKGEPI